MDEGPINVLLADDDEGFLTSLRELVDRQPELHVVATARNGLDAVELAARHRPDAAVIDLHMPLLDGLAAIARLREQHTALCLIALTGDDDVELHQAVRQAGADAVLEKSEMVGMLIDRLTRARSARASGEGRI
ncbi:MAG TPA: response regulator transcription factor [Gaiellaceae bacterium]